MLQPTSVFPKAPTTPNFQNQSQSKCLVIMSGTTLALGVLMLLELSAVTPLQIEVLFTETDFSFRNHWPWRRISLTNGTGNHPPTTNSKMTLCNQSTASVQILDSSNAYIDIPYCLSKHSLIKLKCTAPCPLQWRFIPSKVRSR